MDYATIVVLKILSTVSVLVIVSLGLAVMFGMMRIINLGHGEFMMLGAYSAVTAFNHGVNVWVAILLVAPLVVGAFGWLVERLVIRHLYGRLVDMMLATWGLSLALVGLVTVVFGNTTAGLRTPMGSVQVGEYRTGAYELVLIAVAIVLLAGGWTVLRHTRAGLLARGTMQNPEMAASLGISPRAVYAITFGAGAALSGLAGGLLAPLAGVVPTMGSAYVANAFITVITGGASILTGTMLASALLGTVGTVVNFASSPVIGDIAKLGIALVLIRLMPQGLTGRFLRGSL